MDHIEFIDVLDTLDGWMRHEITTTSTIVIRPNQAFTDANGKKPYADVRVRRALAYRSGEAWNAFAWANPDFDANLEKALATPDTEDRRKLMAIGEQIVRDEGVTIQPYWRKLFNHSREGLGGGEQHIADNVFPARLYWKA